MECNWIRRWWQNCAISPGNYCPKGQTVQVGATQVRDWNWSLQLDLPATRVVAAFGKCQQAAELMRENIANPRRDPCSSDLLTYQIQELQGRWIWSDEFEQPLRQRTWVSHVVEQQDYQVLPGSLQNSSAHTWCRLLAQKLESTLRSNIVQYLIPSYSRSWILVSDASFYCRSQDWAD